MGAKCIVYRLWCSGVTGLEFGVANTIFTPTRTIIPMNRENLGRGIRRDEALVKPDIVSQGS